MITLNRRRVMGVGAAPLPYDAQVEYLESTGTQWIDLGLVAKWTTDSYIDIGFLFLDNSANQRAFGAMKSTLATEGFQMFFNKSTNICGMHTFNTRYSSIAFGGEKMFSYHDWKITNSTIYIDGVANRNDATSNSLTINCYLFARNNNNNGADNISKLKLYYFKYYNGSTLVDFIPVRVGTTGYMYDRVSGQLFGNSGTGDFVLGPDKN